MNQNYINEILLILRSNKGSDYIKEELLNYHENDIAKIFPLLSKEERFKLYKILDQENLSDIFSYLDEPTEYFNEMSNDTVVEILENMDTDDAIDILEEMEEDERKKIIDLMDQEVVDDIKLISSYNDDMIGSKMTLNYISISRYATVKKAMKTMIQEAAINDNVSTLYFVDDDDTFYGAMDLRDLIIARDSSNLDDLIKTSYPYLKATELVSECLGKIKDYAFDSIPIVDDKKRLIGVITSDDIIEAVTDEMGDDYAKLGGLSCEDDLDESVFKSIGKRMPWLCILLGLGLMTSLIISGFEPVVEAIPLLVFFQSLILDMAGNTGTQSLAVTIRVISNEQATKKDIIKLILKELKVGLINGLIIGSISFVAVLLFLMFVKSKDAIIIYNVKIALSIGVSMLASIVVANAAGTIIPVIFKKCKVDPAVASGPLITTLNDIIAVSIYYGLAWLLFKALIG